MVFYRSTVFFPDEQNRFDDFILFKKIYKLIFYVYLYNVHIVPLHIHAYYKSRHLHLVVHGYTKSLFFFFLQKTMRFVRVS